MEVVEIDSENDLSSRSAQPSTCIFCQSRCSQREKRRITPKVAEYIAKETGRLLSFDITKIPSDSDALCNKCRTVILKFLNESIYNAESHELGKLQFRNPGKFMEDFRPEKSNREMRKAKRKTYNESSRKAHSIYDEKGRLMKNRVDLCDCLDNECPGCFFPCQRCSSEKCGSQCRVNRRWFYLHLETEGHGDRKRFPYQLE